MYPYIHIVIPSYTALALVGGFATLCLIYFRLERNEIEFTCFLKMFFLCILGGIIGSKVLFAITQIGWLAENFSAYNLLMLIPQSGFVFYGGLFGVIFTLLFLTRSDPVLREKIFRLSVPGMPLFHAFGRIGCFLAGCCYGKDLATPIEIGGLRLTRFPVQLVEALAEFCLFIIILVIDSKKKNADLLKVYLVSYALIRFFDELLRGDEVRGIWMGLSTAQWISIIIIVYYLCCAIMKNRLSLFSKLKE